MAALVQRSAIDASCQRLTLRQMRRTVPHHVLDDVGAGQRAAQLSRKAETDDSQDFAEALQDAGGDAGGLLLQAAGEVADQPFGLVGIIQFPRLTQCLAHRGMPRLGQTFEDVADLVDLATLDRGVTAEVLANRFGQRLGSIDDEQRQTLGSRPRSIRLSSSACTTVAFSVAPSITASGCLSPAPSTPTAASRTRSSPMWMPSIWITSRSSFDRSEAIHSFMRSADKATKWREAADLERPAPLAAGTSSSGRRRARPNLRVETLISIRFSAHWPSQSSASAASQLGNAISPPSRARTRGRSSSTLPP